MSVSKLRANKFIKKLHFRKKKSILLDAYTGNWCHIHILVVLTENLNNREGQTDSTFVEKYYITWNKKGFRSSRVFIEGPYI